MNSQRQERIILGLQGKLYSLSCIKMVPNNMISYFPFKSQYYCTKQRWSKKQMFRIISLLQKMWGYDIKFNITPKEIDFWDDYIEI